MIILEHCCADQSGVRNLGLSKTCPIFLSDAILHQQAAWKRRPTEFSSVFAVQGASRATSGVSRGHPWTPAFIFQVFKTFITSNLWIDLIEKSIGFFLTRIMASFWKCLLSPLTTVSLPLKELFQWAGTLASGSPPPSHSPNNIPTLQSTMASRSSAQSRQQPGTEAKNNQGNEARPLLQQDLQ